MKNKICKPRKNEGSYDYVLMRDIIKVHGESWAKKFDELIYGSTGAVIKYKGKEEFGIYYHDYTRFRAKIDHNTPTYFD